MLTLKPDVCPFGLVQCWGATHCCDQCYLAKLRKAATRWRKHANVYPQYEPEAVAARDACRAFRMELKSR